MGNGIRVVEDAALSVAAADLLGDVQREGVGVASWSDIPVPRRKMRTENLRTTAQKKRITRGL